jgi:hypothetical protein
MDYRNKLVVAPGTKVRLSKIDASFTGGHETHQKAQPEIDKHVERMGKLQYLLYADGLIMLRLLAWTVALAANAATLSVAEASCGQASESIEAFNNLIAASCGGS